MTKNQHLFLAVCAMLVTVAASNYLVQFPVDIFCLHEVLTYGAFIYPFAFLVNDLTNRRYGPQAARRVVYIGFVAGLIVSWALAKPRLAIASAMAFLFAQLLDILVFSPLRRKTWWKAPLAAALTGSLLDTILFFSVGFSYYFGFLDTVTGYPDGSILNWTEKFGVAMPVWLSLSLGDFIVKVVMGFLMLIPYGAILAIFMPNTYRGGSQFKR